MVTLSGVLAAAAAFAIFIALVVLVLWLVSRKGDQETRQTASVKLQAHLKSGAISRHPGSLGK